MDVLIVIITLVTNSFLGGLIYLRDRTSRKSQLFGVMSGAIALWILSNFITNYANGDSLVLNDIANRIAFIAGYGVVFAGLLFTYVFPKQRKVNTYEIVLVYLLAAIVMLLSSTSLVSGEVKRSHDGLLEFTIGPLLWLYMAAFLTNVGLLVKNLVGTIRRDSGTKRSQSVLVLLAFGISAPVGLIINLVLPVMAVGWQVTQFGPLSTIILVSLIAYSIVKHGLFDIRLAAVRTVTYILALASLSVIYYFLAYVVSTLLFHSTADSSVSVSPINILLALLLAFIFQPIKRFFDRVTDKIFYRGRYHTDEFYARLSEVLTTTTDLRSLLQRASKEIASTLKAEHASFFVQYSNTHYMSAGTLTYKAVPVSDIRSLNDYIDKIGSSEVIVTELLQDRTMRRLLISHKIAVLMPLMREKKIFGYLMLGEHQGGGFTNRDVRMLTTVSDELVIAIQNALSVQEVKDINESLQQRISEATRELRTSNARLLRIDATKDEFLSMASHQLRTPLTSIKGYLSMVLEGDAGKITNIQRHLLGEAFNGSERMVHLIHDFLNVSRIQTGKFLIEKKQCDLGSLVRDEINSLVSVAEVRGLKLKAVLPAEPVLLNLDESKIRQVVMNFIDNAIYYSKPGTTIVITLTVGRGSVKVTVVDHGIGVPVAQQEKLFTKFFRADNARKQRPDGTGVGLYLAKKVVDGHNGKLIFASKEDQGSTFGFELPLKDSR